jgi:hypothetical protein
LNECIIDNAYDFGIISLNSSITAKNCLISNCGKNIYLVKGGNYQFTHCTVASFGSSFIQHKDPVLFLSNYININNAPVAEDMSAVFRNCIFWGDEGLVDNEVVTEKNNTKAFNVTFTNALWRVKTTPANIISTAILNNQPPKFDSISTSRNYYDFRIQNGGSPAIDAGLNAGISTDQDGKPRPAGPRPDLGCYEKQ